jgi:uncharacterized protein (DUF58 family)
VSIAVCFAAALSAAAGGWLDPDAGWPVLVLGAGGLVGVLLLLTPFSRQAVPGRPRVRPKSASAWSHLGWILVLAGLVGAGPTSVLLGCLLVAASFVSTLLARAHVLRVRLVRDLPPRARVGKPVALTWRLENPGSSPCGAYLVRDGLGALARPSLVEVVVEEVRPGGAAEASARVEFARRGWKHLKPATVSTRHPFGACEASVSTVAAASVLVRPREGQATGAFLARLRGATAAVGRVESARAGSDRFHGVREWREGDDPRRIHWRTTARRGVRTFVEWREEEARRAVVVLARGDRGVPEAGSERAISLAATALRACVRAGIRARLVLAEGGSADDAGTEVRGRGGLERALDALAVVRWGGGRRPREWLAGARRHAGATTVAWIGVGPDAEAARAAREAAGGAFLHLRADDPVRLRRYVRGLP